MKDGRIPVTLLTGFLGAGKTTVLNALLKQETKERVAVIVNEFGEAGLDHDLIETASDDVVLMSSGCLCCTVRGELADTILDLIARRDAGAFDFDRVVIETTGLADPKPILHTMLVEGALAQSTRMDGVVTVVDAVNGDATLNSQFEAVSQVAMADMIVMSKVDLVPYDQIITFETRLSGLNKTAPILASKRGENIADKLWGLSGLRQGVKPSQARAWLGKSGSQTAPVQDHFANLSGFTASKSHKAVFSPHDARIQTASITLDDPLEGEVFDRWLSTLVLRRSENLLRVKGVVFLIGIEMPFVFHGVQQIFDPPVPVPDWPQNDCQSRIVVIARDIPLSELESSFDMLRPSVKPQKELVS
ncbi:MAG: CobW family GTP-binding protein [Shimia sp.]|uniref:CobW family GTP-binding protein n=1 Tax=Shimia sp. TaxID=1954381 RepID=UPI0040580A53